MPERVPSAQSSSGVEHALIDAQGVLRTAAKSLTWATERLMDAGATNLADQAGHLQVAVAQLLNGVDALRDGGASG